MSKSKFWLAFLFLVIFVGAFAGISVYNHPSPLDDYANYLNFIEKGFWGYQEFLWNFISSRFSTYFVIPLGFQLGVIEHYPWQSVSWILISLCSLYFLITSFFGSLETKMKIFLTFLLQAIWLGAAVGLSETLYWYVATFYYFAFVVLVLELALMARLYNEESAKYALALAITAFLGSGIMEVLTLYQLPLFLFGAIFCYMSQKKRAGGYMLCFFAIAVVGLIIQITGPGNAARGANMGQGYETKNLLTALKVAAMLGPVTAIEFFLTPIIYALLLFIPVIAENVKQPPALCKFKFRMWHIVVFQFLSSCGFYSVGGFATGGGLPPRILGLVRWIMLAQWILFFVFCYRNEKVTARIKGMFLYGWRAAVLALCLLLGGNFILLVDAYKKAPEYSNQLDARYGYFEEQKKLGHLDVEVPMLTNIPHLIHEADFQPDDISYWAKNSPLARYYGLNTIRAIPDSLKDIKRDPGKVTDDEIQELTRFAENGVVEAQFILAEAFDPRGAGNGGIDLIPKDYSESVKWYIKAAEQGNRRAARALVGPIRRGFGTPDGKPDYLAAVKWYLLSMW